MFDPNNNHQLYEGHLQEATLNLNWTTKSFHRRHVNNVTNAVMSPVNMVKPDFSVSTLNCHGSSKSKLDLLTSFKRFELYSRLNYSGSHCLGKPTP